jgi:hypothetical protein
MEFWKGSYISLREDIDYIWMVEVLKCVIDFTFGEPIIIWIAFKAYQFNVNGM